MKCECCGHINGRKYNPQRRIIELIEAREHNNKLKDVIRLIRKEIPSDKDNQKTFYFLQAISKIPDDAVEKVIHNYVTDEHVYQGKGFAYLQRMIIDGYANRSKMIENEIKKFGRTPKKVKVERGEYKNVYSSNGGNPISS